MENLLKKTVMIAGIAAVFYLVLFVCFDRDIDWWVHNNCSKTWLPQAGNQISYLATGPFVSLGIALGFILIIIIDRGITRRWTRDLLYICLSGSIAMIIGEGFKFLLARYRPVMLFEHNLYGLHFFSSEWAMNSTPSGHTLRAFSLLTALSMRYRRDTAVFISIATLIGASRVAVTAHYPSDVLFGAFIGIFTALWTYRYFFDQDN